MIRSFLLVAWRNLRQNKLVSFINIAGLAIGMTFAMLVALWINYETSFDQFHLNKDRIALILKNTEFNGQKNTQEPTPLPLYAALKNNYPEVKRASRLTWKDDRYYLSIGDKRIKSSSRFADPDFLGMFSFPVIKGNAATALDNPSSIVLTASLATALFGQEDPVGKTVLYDNEYNLQVTAVMKDVPANSTIDFDFLMPYQFVIDHDSWVKGNADTWSNNFLMNVVELKEGASMTAFSHKIAPLNMQKDKTLKNQFLFAHPLNKWHLYNDFSNWVNTGGRIFYVRLFAAIGSFVLFIACINFMNLSTARSEKRAREVGIRKAIGSARLQLILQFLCEAMLTAFLAFLFAMGLIRLLLPLLSNLGFAHIRFNLNNTPLVLTALAVCLITGLIAGSYPALYLSSFKPVEILKGFFKQGKSPVAFRRTLVVFQFSISIALIISTIIVLKQIHHGQNRAIGYNPDRLLYIPSSKDLLHNYNALKQDLLNSGQVSSVATASQPLTVIYNQWSDFSWEGKDPAADISLDAILAGLDFEQTAGFQFKEGRPFSRAFPSDSAAVILNEAAVKMMGYQNPVGKTMKLQEEKLTIIGVVKDIVLTNPFKSVAPLAILLNRSSTNSINDIFIRLKPGVDIASAVAHIKPVFKQYNPSQSFEYRFADDEYSKKFTLEKQVSSLASIFSVLAIFISCLGLLGLAMFMAERRAKEIGIRKVLGASVTQLWLLLSREFVQLVLLAFVIASPLVYWFMQNWLQQYEYRISISWFVFAFSGLLTTGIALLTVSLQAVQAARANPVKKLKSE
jgi:ABC-type antimicrobial peptide transport system permease subunit